MAAFPSLVLTNAGVTLQNKVQGGATLEFTNIQMGSGQLNGQPIGPMTALISPNATVPIQGGQAIGQNTYQVEGFFTNANLSAGFWWREIGIFANDPDNGEILYAYANAGDAGDYIPTVTDQRIEKYIYFSMALANATTVNVTIPQSDTYVLQSTVGQPNGVAGLDSNGAVPIAQGGTGATTAQGAVDALGVLLAVAAAAAYDPEGSYAVGDYCTHGGKLHKCGTAIPDGEEWNAAHWTETSVAAELAEVRASLSNKVSKQYPYTSDAHTIGIGQFYWCDQNTDNTPYKAGLTSAQQGIVLCTAGNAAENWCTLLYIAHAQSEMFIQSRVGEWNKWIPFSLATPPQENDMLLENGFTALQPCTWRKNQFGEVNLGGCVSGNISDGVLVATMPVGCRPNRIVERPATFQSLDSGYTRYAGSVMISPDGNVLFHITGTANYGIFSADYATS